MYGIVTRYHGPTNYRGSRWIATGPRMHSDSPLTRATVSYEEDRGRRAAVAVLAKLRADGWRVGLGSPVTLPDESGYVWPLEHSGAPLPGTAS